MILELNIADKANSPEKLEATQGVPASQKITAEEFNAMVDKVNDLINEANKKAANLTNPNDEKFPTTKAVVDGLATKVTKAEKEELAITSAVDVHNLEPAGKGLFSFSNAINVTGIKTTSFYDGQVITLLNLSNGLLTVMHMNNQSLAENMIFSNSGQNISLKTNSFIFLRYSKIRNRLEIIDVFGTDVLPSLAYGGNAQRVVTVTPEGVCFAEDIMEYEVFDDTTAGFANLAAIVQAYPTSAGRKKGFQVVCPYTTPPCILKKCSDGDERWIKITASIL